MNQPPRTRPQICVLADMEQALPRLADWSAIHALADVEFINHPPSGAALRARIAHADALVLVRDRVPLHAALIAELPQLRYVVFTGTRNTTLDLAALQARGIPVSHTEWGPSKDSTCEMTWALILGALRQMEQETARLRAGLWRPAEARALGGVLHGETLGLIGLGEIGSRVARVGQAFGMQVLTWSPNMTPERAAAHGVRAVSLERYGRDLIQPGDVLTIGETPLAVMQGRYHHPATVQPSMLARLLCRVFHPTSSLATACGLQTLIDIVGPARVLTAWLAGSALKLVGVKGGFYRLAGDQARLIDDITGTTPPYDQTLVLGPDAPEHFCNRMAALLGVGVAVVDVNDLGRVKVLAASRGCDEELLQRALRPNPAGNANERTPIVLVRPA